MAGTGEIILAHNKKGKILLGIISFMGIVPIKTFDSFQELRKFSMGILGYCEYFDPEVPEVFTKAFDKEEDKNGS